MLICRAAASTYDSARVVPVRLDEATDLAREQCGEADRRAVLQIRASDDRREEGVLGIDGPARIY
jgi:hypothetical protein